MAGDVWWKLKLQMKFIPKRIGDKAVWDLIPIAWITSFAHVSLHLIGHTDILNALQI